MAVRYEEDIAILEGQCQVEEAGDLAEWLIADATRKVDAGPCTGLHSAMLQTLMALRPQLVRAPEDETLARWIAPFIRCDPAATSTEVSPEVSGEAPVEIEAVSTSRDAEGGSQNRRASTKTISAVRARTNRNKKAQVQ